MTVVNNNCHMVNGNNLFSAKESKRKFKVWICYIIRWSVKTQGIIVLLNGSHHELGKK